MRPPRRPFVRRASINPSWHANNSWKKSSGHTAATLQLITDRGRDATPRPATGVTICYGWQARTAIPSNCVDNACGSFFFCASLPPLHLGATSRMSTVGSILGHLQSLEKNFACFASYVQDTGFSSKLETFQNNLIIYRIYLFWYFIDFIWFIKNTCILFIVIKMHFYYM